MKTEPTTPLAEVDQPRLVSPWRDVSSFSQGTKDRTPRTWYAQFGRFKMTLTRHIHYAPDAWVATCEGVFDLREMASKDVREAACQAKAMLQVELETAIQAILGANEKSAGTAPVGEAGQYPQS
jgi:hypothetical protein